MRRSQAPSSPFRPSPAAFGHFDYDLLNSLQSRETRDRLGLYFVEGQRFACAALESGAPIVGYAWCPELLAQSQVLRRLAGKPAIKLTRQQFESLRFAPEPQGIALVLRQQPLCLSKVKPDRCGTWIGVESIRNPGNLGCILRAMKAAGAEGLMIFGNRGQTLDPFDPGVVRASMGASISLPIVGTTYEDLRRWSYRSEIRVLGADAEGPLDFRSVKFRRPVLIMIGNERTGLSPGQRSVCDGLVRIPMEPGIDSLNVAMAATVMLFEAHGQKQIRKRR
jgi:TrmH family RNA methyltransferase